MLRSGQTAYRCLIPMADIMADPVSRPLFDGQDPGFWAPALPQKGVMAVTYPCRENKVMNCIVLHRKLGQHALSAEDVETIEDWNFPATHDDLKVILEGFHPSIIAMLMKTPEVKVYSQMKRNPLKNLTKGKVIMIGDAAHPMLLTHAQGVSSSIEDGAALEVLLAGVPATSGVDSKPSQLLLERLALFEKLRLPRVSATQIMTDPVTPGPNAAPMQTKVEAEIRKYYSGPLPPKDSFPHSKPICDFFFAYDVRKDAAALLAGKEPKPQYPLPVKPPLTAAELDKMSGYPS
jgi:salicylate hydroxylase